jgi:dienelactone hydrolase
MHSEPAAPTPTPTPTWAADATDTPSTTAVPVTTPVATAATGATIQGVWASEPLTRQMIETAVLKRGGSADEASQLSGAHAFVDYMVYELVVTGSDWKLNEVPDGLPWGSWNNAYRMPDPTTVSVLDGPGRCRLTFRLDFATATDLNVAVEDDSCGATDKLTHVATFEAAPFHRVEGAGAAQASLQPNGHAAAGGPPTGRGMKSRPLGTVDGARMGYLEYLPPNYGSRPSPLLVALHGSGQSGSGDEASLPALYDLGIPLLIRNGSWPGDRPFLVLAPQHNTRSPEVCITADEIADFLQFAVAHNDVDPERVYLTGLSCGAIGGWNYLAQHLDDTVAAAVLIAGGGYAAVDVAGCDLGRIPIWAFHGALDDVVPVRYSANSIARLQQCTDPPPVDARLTVYPDAGHDSWTRTYNLAAGNDIYDWMLGYKR